MNKRLHDRWKTMRQRSNNPNNLYYKWYGAKGITICEEWNTYSNFETWALANGYRDDLTLDRIDNSKGYSPDNCRYVDRKTQANNRSYSCAYNIDGLTLGEFCRQHGLNYAAIKKRLSIGWTMERALTTPVRVRLRE